MNRSARRSSASPPARGALVMLVFEDAEVLDIAGPLDILCAAAVRDPRVRRRPLRVSERGSLVRTYPSGIALDSQALAAVTRTVIDTLLVPGGQGVEQALQRPALIKYRSRF